jgi:hypothetical protein
MISPDELVLGCYELASFYHVDPRIFLEQTIHEIKRHKRWTEELIRRRLAAEEAASRSES